MESGEDMVSRLDSMASGEPSWDLSDNDMNALEYALQFVPGSDFYKPPAAENQGGPDSASTNSAMNAICPNCHQEAGVPVVHITNMACMHCHYRWSGKQHQ